MSTEDRYDSDIKKYRELVHSDSQRALDQFGISLLYSLNPADRVRALRDLGFEANRAVDFYNLGVQAMQDENFTEAIINFKQSIELDSGLTDAIYNLALCYEKTGHTPQAIQTWDVYQDVCEDEDEKEIIKEHLAELG